MKPLLSNTNAMSEKITLIEDDKMLSKDAEVAECLNTYFTNITDSLDIAPTFREVHEVAGHYDRKTDNDGNPKI